MTKRNLDSDVAYLLECGICLEEHKDPRALPCLHSFCLRCLKQHISATKARDGSFHCPKCRDKFTPPEGDVEKFPRNFFLNSLKDTQRSTSKHLKGPVVPTQCEPHKNKPDWYCQTCNLPGCAECMLRYHKFHESVEVESIACKLEPDLLAVCTLAVKRLATLQNMSSDIDSRETKMERDTAQACGEITKAADDMRKLITGVRKETAKQSEGGQRNLQKASGKRQKRMRRVKERYFQPECVCRETESDEVSTAHCSACTYCQARDATAARRLCSIRGVEGEQNQCQTLGDISRKCLSAVLRWKHRWNKRKHSRQRTLSSSHLYR